MKKSFGLFSFVMLALLFVTTSSRATPIYYDNNWYANYGPNHLGNATPFIASIGGNDNPNVDLADLNQVIDDWNSYFDGDPLSDADWKLPYLAIVTPAFGSGVNSVNTTIDVTGYTYLTVKYGGHVDIFNVQGMDSLDWSAAYLRYNGAGKPLQNALSHYRLWNPTPAAPVPEPAAILLLGSGLLGLAAMGRKNIFKK